MARAIQSGKGCIKTVSRALQYMKCGNVEAAARQLQSVQSDGSKLKTLVQEALQKLEHLELEQIAKEKDIYREIGQLDRKKGALQMKIRTTKEYSETKIAQLKQEQWKSERKVREARGDLQTAKRRANDAENRVASAKTERKVLMGVNAGAAGAGGAVVGMAIGILGGPIGMVVGAVIGAAAGTAGGAAVGKGLSDVNEARRNLSQAQQHESRCESELSDRKRQVEEYTRECNRESSRLNNEMQSLNGQISQLNRRQQEECERLGRIKHLIVYMKRAKNFWGDFGNAVQHGMGRGDILQKIVDKANEKQDPEFLGRLIKSTGTKKTTVSFIEAWEEVEQMLNEDILVSSFTYLTC